MRDDEPLKDTPRRWEWHHGKSEKVTKRVAADELLRKYTTFYDKKAVNLVTGKEEAQLGALGKEKDVETESEEDGPLQEDLQDR